jgi:hypothetical protein
MRRAASPPGRAGGVSLDAESFAQILAASPPGRAGGAR